MFLKTSSLFTPSIIYLKIHPFAIFDSSTLAFPKFTCYQPVMSDLASKITEDIKSAMRAKDKLSLNALRALKSALTNAAIEKSGLGTELDDTESLAVVRKQIKQRQDSIEQFEKANRPELAESENAEIDVLSKYLPASLSEDELSAIVSKALEETGASSKADMGKAMKRAQELAEGRADGKALSSAVMARLN